MSAAMSHGFHCRWEDTLIGSTGTSRLSRFVAGQVPSTAPGADSTCNALGELAIRVWLAWLWSFAIATAFALLTTTQDYASRVLEGLPASWLPRFRIQALDRSELMSRREMDVTHRGRDVLVPH